MLERLADALDAALTAQADFDLEATLAKLATQRVLIDFSLPGAAPQDGLRARS